MSPIASMLSKLLATRLGSAAAKAASGMRGGLGGLAKPPSPESVNIARTMAEAYGSRNEPPKQPRQRPESSGMFGRTIRHVVDFAKGYMGKMPEDDSGPADRRSPQQSPRAAAIRSSFGDILAGRTSLQAATQQQQDRQDRQQQSQQPPSSGSGIGGAAIGLALKHPVAAAGLLASAFGAAAVAAKRLGEAQAEGLKHLRAYNGQIAAAYGRMARSDILRTRQQAASTAGSTSALVDAVSEMRDAWAPVENAVTNIKNTIGTAGAKLFKQIGAGLSVLIAIGEKVGIIAKAANQPKGGPWQQTINDLAKMHRERNQPKKRPDPPKRGRK